ncbi:MAG: putative LPS assembly protein LptD, partial [Syntrophothermus sp.]
MKSFIAIFLLFIFVDIFPQDSTFFRNDSLRILNDSLKISTDTTGLADTVSQKKYDVDTVIYAKSTDSLIFFIKKREMNLYGKSELQYKETDLKSGNIKVDFNTNNIDAVGVPNDTVPGKIGDTPVLSEKGEVYEGKRMTYNFKTLKGFISSAETEMEGAIYSGEKIKKVDKDTYFIENGIYTTCNADTPHYCFYGSEMKVIHKEQIISKWIWLYFGGVPFPVPIPFAVFPIESGRRSGILPPAFGDNANYGRYFSRFGYFWAINDYVDINFTGDYFTRGSYNVNSRFRYYKRYDFSGELNGGYSNFVTGEASDLERSKSINWNIRWNHNQEIDPTMRFDANLQFMSGKDYNLRTSTNLNDVLNRNIESNANFFKSWEEAGTSLSLSYTRNQNLDNGNIDERLPNLTFNKSQSYPFRSKNSVGQQKWYELF